MWADGIRRIPSAHIFDHNPHEIVATRIRWKGSSIRRPLILSYTSPLESYNESHIRLISRWYNLDSDPTSSFEISLRDGLQRALLLSGQHPPEGCCYTSHSSRIGGYNERSVLQFPKEFIIRRLYWDTETMLRVYHDSRISVNDSSTWFFGHLRPTQWPLQ